ncbi:uncharacterized protein LOC107156666 isoform X2 [Marmota marmota marmota]|uniref:uncharacterized protein LOC107156666 isoform X2 n=1 Tax=Marmota marmota marmota TaxID=9994 RepID=UPI0020938F1D|nr:uncharacterized protein LOC107156666 isoform X2 [Marmota marmota marmota]
MDDSLEKGNVAFVHWGMLQILTSERRDTRRNLQIWGACSTLAKSSGAHGSGIKGFRTHTYLKAIRGSSVLLQVIQEPEDPKIEEISWGVITSESNSTFVLRLQNGKEDPLWFSLQDKYKQRVQVPSMSSLRINNLTSQDSGQYWAQIMFQTGREIKPVFHLTVYDPVPLAQIWTTSASITPSWCNVTLECGAREAVEVLNVTWEVQGPPSELEQRGAPGPPNPWTLALSLPPSQPNVSFTCVLSNPVDQKNATLELLDLCSPAGHTRGAMGAFLAGFFILGVGGFLFLWHLREKEKKKKKMEMEMERGLEVSLAQNQAPVCQDSDAGLPEDPRAKDDAVYAQLAAQDSLKGKRKVKTDIDDKHLEGKGPCTSVYSMVQRPGQALKMTY